MLNAAVAPGYMGEFPDTVPSSLFSITSGKWSGVSGLLVMQRVRLLTPKNLEQILENFIHLNEDDL